MINDAMAAFGYPNEPDFRQSAVWFPFLPEPSYDDDTLLNCSSFLVHKNGDPQVLLCPAESYDLYSGLASNKSVFSQPPPYLVRYQGENLSTYRLIGDHYERHDIVPRWDELDSARSGCLAEARADGEVLAVRESVAQWLKVSYSKKAVERLMSIHTQRAGVIKELIQNACDCFATEIQFDLQENILTFRHDGYRFMPTNVHAITALNFSCKPPGAIGYKGIGFKAVYQVCRRPQVSSGPFRFAFEPVLDYANATKAKMLNPYLPVVDHNIDYAQVGWTEFRFPLEPNCVDGIVDALSKLKSTLLLFVAGRGLPLRRITVPGRVIELAGELSGTGGIVPIVENDCPDYWFYARHQFVINKDRQSALDDFVNSTGREDISAPFGEEITVAVPLSLNENGVLAPNVEYVGRFHSFIPTLDEYEYPWDINANFLLDEQRDHLRPPDKATWNAALLDECGQALLHFLDEVNAMWRKDSNVPISAYYNVIPKWDEIAGPSPIGLNFTAMQSSFCLHFAEKPRVLTFTRKRLGLKMVSQAIWIDRQLSSLFSQNSWLKLMPKDTSVASWELDEDIWEPILRENCMVPLFDVRCLMTILAEKDWPARLGIGLNSGELVPLIGRLCCYLAGPISIGVDSKAAYLLLDSNRNLYRPIDKPDGKSICRALDDEFTNLPKYISEQVVIAHDGVMRFMQKDPSYFKGIFAEDLADDLRTRGRSFWIGLMDTLDLTTVIRRWLNPIFEQGHDGEPENFKRRMDCVYFLFENRERVQRKGLYRELRVRLLARVGRGELWKPPEEIWLFGACPQGRDVEIFIGDTPDVPLLSRKHAENITVNGDVDGAALGTFFCKVGVQTSIKSVYRNLGYFSPWSEEDKKDFCQSLGIDFDRMPSGNINQRMDTRDYDFSPDIISAFNNTLSQSVNFVHRSERLRSFARLLENSWDGLSKTTQKEGRCHLYGAQVDVVVPGSPSTLANRLRETEWIPLANDPRILKRPRETCRLTDSSIQLAESTAEGNYADIDFENQELVTFLGFGQVPQGLTALDIIRGLSRNWSKVQNPKGEFERLYGELASDLGTRVDMETARKVFLEEFLIFIPARQPYLRKSNEVLCGADSRFEGFLEDLADFYPPSLHGLFKRIGVASHVEEIHYLRYLTAYVWTEQPPIDDRRRSLILKCYRQLTNWAKTIPAGQGVWMSQEGKMFSASLLFYGRRLGKLGWYSGHENNIVFRDEPQIEAVLADQSGYVLESFLAQLRRTEEGLDPFLKMFNVRPASQLAVRQTRSNPNPTILSTGSNFRQNLSRLIDVLGPRLKQQLEEEFRDDVQAQTYFEKVTITHNLAATAELYGCTDLLVVIKETITGHEKLISCDASLNFGDGRATAFILGSTCGGVGPQIARDLKGWLRTDTLPEQIGIQVDSIIEDVASWLDKSPDQFEERLQQILARHLPSLSSVVEVPKDSGGYSITLAQGGASQPATGKGPEPDTSGIARATTPTQAEIAKEPQQPLMPDIKLQKVTVVERPPEECLVFPKGTVPHSEGGNRSTRKISRQTDQQRSEIGRQAELLVFEQEIDKLNKAGRADLARKVVDRNREGYDPNGPYDIDSFSQDEAGEWIPAMLEVKGHLDSDAYWFDISEAELRIALLESSTPYLLYLVLNLSQQDVRIEILDFRKLWREERLRYQARSLRIELRPVIDDKSE
jgi:Domain of unknown function (DUF3883)